MHMNLPGNQNRSFSTPRAHSPCKIALYPGHAPFWPDDVLGGILACVLGNSDRSTWAEPCWRLADGRARSNARGAPIVVQMFCDVE